MLTAYAHSMTVRIETPRLILRPFTLADVDDVTAYQSVEECVRYVPFNVRSRDEVLAAFERQRPSDHITEPGNFFILGMELKATGHVIGQVNLGFEAASPKTASFGYLTHNEYWRQGFTREAVTALLDYAIGVEHIEQFTAVIVDQNEASIRLAESLGMHFTGSRPDPESPCTTAERELLNDYTMSAATWLANRE